MGIEKSVIGVCDDDPADVVRICKELVRCMILLGEKEPLLYTCQSGKEMLEECQKRKMKLVLLDLEMPERGGFDLAEQLYAMNPGLFLFQTMKIWCLTLMSTHRCGLCVRAQWSGI